MVEHPPFSDFEAFVAGGTPGTAGFDAHVSHCDACAALLEREAKVELVACAAARELRSRRDWMSRMRGPGYLMGALVAVAAALFALLRAMNAAAAVPEMSPDDVHGQPMALYAADGGMDVPFVAVRDAGPVRPPRGL